MFSIIVIRAMQEYNRLERQQNEMVSQLLELEQAIDSLESLSCMEEPIAVLKKEYSEMEAEYDVLKHMSFVLEQIISTYINCENRICENAEYHILVQDRSWKL